MVKIVAANLHIALKVGGLAGERKAHLFGKVCRRSYADPSQGDPRRAGVSGNRVRGPQGMRLSEGKGYRM